jgi:alpha-mannosidase
VLFNQAHDLSSGVMVDKVYDDSMQRYHQARRLADEVVHKNVELISSKINTAGQGEPIVVFNTLGWPRSDIAEVDVAFSNAGVQTFALVDSEGHAQPVQYLGVLRNDDGGIRQARIAFIAQNVPAMGYTVYHAVPNATGSPSGAAQVHRSMHEDSGAIENEFYRASFDLWTGQMTSLVLKENQWEALSAPGNVVAREHDGGDFWELYGTLNGGRLTAMKKEIPPPRAAYTQWSRDFVGGSGIASSGPVFSEFRIAHPLGKNQFATRVRMYQGLRRIDISTELLNQEEFVRYRVVFPTSVRNGKAVHEIPFGAIERAERQEFPAQNWIDYSDGERGVALINRGVPGNNVADGKLMLSLMRSTRLISYGYIGGFEPGVGSDTGLGIGKKYTLDYAVLPHRGNWQDAAPWRAGLELNNPLIAMPVAPHTGELPAKWSLLESSHSNVVVSALKPGRNGMAVLRVYEAAGKPVHNASVKLRVAISRLQEANLIEDTLRDLETRNDGFSFDLKPYEIRTFKFALKAQTVARR